MRRFWRTLKRSVKGFGEDRAPMLAAALAYYTVFSIAPLGIILIAIVGLVYGSEEARSQLVSQLQQTIGPDAAGLIETMIERTNRGGSGLLATIIGVVTLLVGASSVFVHLQRALDEVWDTEAPKEKGFMHMLLLRARSLGMVLVLGLLLMVSFALQAAVNIVVNNFSGVLPLGDWFWYIVNIVVTLALFTVVFAGLFKVVPDVDLTWSDVLPGAILTAVLFKIGEIAIGFYLSTSAVRSTYGAAGSLVVLLLWIYYSSQILLFGAEFTRADTFDRTGVDKGGGASRAEGEPQPAS